MDSDNPFNQIWLIFWCLSKLWDVASLTHYVLNYFVETWNYISIFCHFSQMSCWRTFLPLAAPVLVIFPTSGVTKDGNVVNIKTFAFQRHRHERHGVETHPAQEDTDMLNLWIDKNMPVDVLKHSKPRHQQAYYPVNIVGNIWPVCWNG